MHKQVQIVIIDDHRIVRQGLKELIENLGDYKVIDEYENGVSFLGALPELEAVPDLFVLDYSMPMLDGIEVLKKALEVNEEYKFLLLTQNFDEQIIDQAYKAGARGFLHKTCTAQELKFAIDNISTIGYTNITEILKRIRKASDPQPKTEPQLKLTNREYTFLEHVCDEQEYTYKQIADLMHVSIQSVDAYRASLFTKLDVKSKVGLVLYSHKHQLTKPFK